MIERNELDNYFMRPQFLEGIGNIYPIKISDYERFSILARKYITQGEKTLHNIYKLDKNINPLDYFVETGMKMDKEIHYLKSTENYIPKSEDEQNKLNELRYLLNLYNSGQVLIYSIYEIEELFSLILRKQVVFKYNTDNIKDYIFDIGDGLYINKDNFEELRQIVMWQNLLYEIPSSESDFINERIQQTLKLNNKDGKTSDLCAMMSIVGCERGLSDEQIFNYTYYRLYYDYSIINRKYTNLFVFMLRSQGCSEAKITELCEMVELRFDPMDLIVDRNAKIMGNALDKQFKS